MPVEVINLLFDALVFGGPWPGLPRDHPRLSLSAESMTVHTPARSVAGILVEVREDGRVLESRFWPGQLGGGYALWGSFG